MLRMARPNRCCRPEFDATFSSQAGYGMSWSKRLRCCASISLGTILIFNIEEYIPISNTVRNEQSWASRASEKTNNSHGPVVRVLPLGGARAAAARSVRNIPKNIRLNCTVFFVCKFISKKCLRNYMRKWNVLTLENLRNHMIKQWRNSFARL